MTRRSWLLVVVVLVVAIGVVVGVVVASSGSGTSAPAAHGPRAHGSSSTAAAPLASLCPAVPDALVAAKLHVSGVTGTSASTEFARGCSWRDAAGNEVLTATTDTQPDMLLLHTLGNDGAVKVGHLGGTAVFAPRPPRLALSVRGTGVAIVIAPAGYHALLPTGATNAARIPRAAALSPLTAFAGSVVTYLTH